MKKTYSFLFAAVALFAAASCQNELINNETPAVQGERFSITAVADAQTKTALTDEGLNSVWTPGDAIAVIDFIGNGAEFTTDITENAASAKFTCENFNVGGMADISALPIVALYPYQEGLTCSIQSQMNPSGDNTIKGITFPNEQTAVAGSFDKSAAFTWAMATGATKDNLVFNNLYSLLKVKVTEENITSITVSATSGSLAGKVTLPLATGALAVVDGQGQSSVTLTCEDGFDTEKYYYICVLPGTYEGFSIALNETVVKTKPTAAVFEAATVYPLGEIAMPAARNLEFSTSSITGYIEGNPFIEPVLSGETSDVVFTSTNPSVATVNSETGKVTLKGKGETTITASAPKSNTHLSETVSYTLIVKVPSLWRLVGNFGGIDKWSIEQGSIPMYEEATGKYVAYDVVLKSDDFWKFLYNNEWDDKKGGGWVGSYSSSNSEHEIYKTMENHGSNSKYGSNHSYGSHKSNFGAATGTYDIYLEVGEYYKAANVWVVRK